jgi:hypothetical protein
MDGVIHNVSFGGAFIRCREPIKLDEVIELVISVPELTEPLRLTAEVVRPRIHGHGNEISSREIGVQIKFETAF